MPFPTHIQNAMKRFRLAGHALYPVGGCVRDTLMGKTPHDWDLTTDATPEKIQEILVSERVLLTGVEHGTVTWVSAYGPVEITTHRIDGGYTDHRHPDRVSFSNDLKEDLSRRDFTINAMAFAENGDVIDLFDGQKDLKDRVIRCVGDPLLRFEEDALRILRALRFASVLEFAVNKETADAVHRLAHRLREVSAERITEEFSKLLCGNGVAAVCREFADVLEILIPEISPLIGFDQHTPYHDKDIWEHTIATVAAVPPVPTLRWTMLLHDIGKAKCFTIDEEGLGHFYGHAAQSTAMVEDILPRFRLSRQQAETVRRLVKYHDLPLPPDEVLLTKRLSRFGPAFLADLLTVQEADNRGSEPSLYKKRQAEREKTRQILRDLEQNKACYTLHSLAIGGRELMELGIPHGPQIGKILSRLLQDVMEKRVENTPSALLAYVKERLL